MNSGKLYIYKLTLFVYLFFQLCKKFKFMNLFNLCTNVVVGNKIVLRRLLRRLLRLLHNIKCSVLSGEPADVKVEVVVEWAERLASKV